MAYLKKGEGQLAREELEKALKIHEDFPGSEEARKALEGLK